MPSEKGWVYNLTDYRQIFGLTDQELQKSVVDYHAGISSVNAELYAAGKTMVSVDPAYHLSSKEMAGYAEEILKNTLLQGGDLLTPEIVSRWRQSVEEFLVDYPIGKKQGRYRPTVTGTFELLLCTHLPRQNLMNELCLWAAEVRIFPLPTDKAGVAAELGPILLALQQRNFGVEIRAVNHLKRPDVNAMLRVWAKQCEINP